MSQQRNAQVLQRQRELREQRAKAREARGESEPPSWHQPAPADPAQREHERLLAADLYGATADDHPEPSVRRFARGREHTLRWVVRRERLLRRLVPRRSIGRARAGRPRARRRRTGRASRAGPSEPGEPPGHPAAADLREAALDGAWERFVVERGMDSADWQTACREAVERGALRRWTP